MHDIVDAYSKRVTAAVERARDKREKAGRLYDEALDRVAADFEADVVAAGAALEAGMQVRAAAFRGEHQRESEAPPVTSALDNVVGDAPYADEEAEALTERDEALHPTEKT